MDQENNTLPPLPPSNDQKKEGEGAPLPNLRTFQSDVASAVQQKQTSVVKIAIAESKRKDNVESVGTTTPKSSKNFIIVFVSILLLVGGGAFVYYIYTTIIPRVPTGNPLITEIKSLVPADREKVFDISNPRIIPDVKEEIDNAELSLNKIENIALTTTVTKDKEIVKQPLTTENFFTIINSTAPGALVRALAPEFMIGVHSGETNSPFFVFKTDYYESVFAGMLKWEPTMYTDLKSFIPAHQEMMVLPTSIGTSTRASSTTPIVEEPLLETVPGTDKVIASDMVIRNKDVRVLKDRRNNILLIYSFVDRNTLIITTNEATFREILDRLEKKVYVR